MVRWEPGARNRLRAAALELYDAQGFEKTTAAEIARSAGLTERTFFRYFADKREVLFGSQSAFEQGFIDSVADAPAERAPLQVVAFAMFAAADFFNAENLADSRLRQAVINAHAELRERELLKMAALSTAVAAALRERGVAEPAATLAAESGVTVFRVSFVQWLADDAGKSLQAIEQDVFKQLYSVNAVVVGHQADSISADQSGGVAS